MGNTVITPPPAFPAAVAGKTRICVIGFKISHHTGRAHDLAALIQSTFPDRFDTWFFFADDASFRGEGGLLQKLQASFPEGHPLKTHRTSPFVWLEVAEAVEGKTIKLPDRDDCFMLPLGGRDRFVEWTLANFPEGDEKNAPIRAAATDPSIFDAIFDKTPGSCQRQ